ncbi:S8 family serine peptidase [Peribacillus psychrosaccharolyticus]|uniref:S8 family serine peptidase n=1 Tax=Peribacillus psychrosaccharolyticus TaxID=1407 RepID=A0A974NN59_PERPY|nr:S8 family serine peptidase [Peribacillus psychrosaccharolyticus]MEC2056101.1 S8 family serine peptidase [Peribacillus psychrosaccharolyticus]MED3745542.1 S8 family serine peptidase [Peribacillus psychrosaccharolyticus]QQT00705.1 S8 family serine peptidase [Peribacillus psychrosaccharolyticus]
MKKISYAVIVSLLSMFFVFNHVSANDTKQYMVVKDAKIKVVGSKSKAMRMAKSSGGIVYEDTKMKAYGQKASWGIKTINASKAWSLNYNGSGIKVGVIDSGVDIRHPDLKIAGGKSFISGRSSYNDDNGHGTHVAGIIGAQSNKIGSVGVAPRAKIYALKALGKDGEGYISDIIEAVNWSVENHMDVINISLGSDDDSYPLKQAIMKATDAGIVVVASAGNEAGQVGYPAKYSNVIGVSALKSNTALASFSNRGSGVTVAAPGENIYSTVPGGYDSYDGTSMAAPFVAGTVALYKQATGLTGDKLVSLVTSSAVDIGARGKDSDFGYGRVNAPIKKLKRLPADQLNGENAVIKAESHSTYLKDRYTVETDYEYNYFPDPSQTRYKQTYADYSKAISVVEKVKDTKVRNALTTRLSAVKELYTRLDNYSVVYNYATKLKEYTELLEDVYYYGYVDDTTVKSYNQLGVLLDNNLIDKAYGPSNRDYFTDSYYDPAYEIYELIGYEIDDFLYE